MGMTDGQLYAACEQQRDQAREERDGAYRERAHLLGWLAILHPHHAFTTDAPDVHEPGWLLLFLNVCGRQLSWHIHPDDAPLFGSVQHVPNDHPAVQWDGHTTEQKYERIRGLKLTEMHRAVNLSR